ncbi:sodium:solute symporter family transporter [Streptomyces sp. cg40]|uniref:sodium:solute symporter family transporter n=1 Tax=Streptomyces sp. cg40 TaxID=3419764 RepID=UPI003D06C352
MLFMMLTLFLTVFSSLDEHSAREFYTGDRTLPAWKSGLALAGSFTSTSLLLTVTGVVATAGFDGITLATSMFLSLGMLLLLARPIRLSGACTLGDLFALRASGTAPRIAAAVATLAVTAPFLIVQLMAAGSVTASLLGFTGIGIQKLCTVLVGCLVVTCGVLSGAKGLTSVQVLAATVIGAAMLVLCASVVWTFHGDVDALIEAAAKGSTHPNNYLRTGGMIGVGSSSRLDFAGGQLALILGSACMPHVLNRVYAMKDTATARRSIRYAAGVVAFLCAAVVLLGFAAAARIGAGQIFGDQANGDGALMLLTRSLTGSANDGLGGLLFTAVACALFLCILSVVGGTTLAAAGALARDAHQHITRNRQSGPPNELITARLAVALFGALGITLAVIAQGHSASFLAQLATTVAASTVAPALLYTFYWSRFNKTGLLWTIYGGTSLTIGLYLFSPAVSGGPTALVPTVDFAWFSQSNPAMVSVPAAFLLGWAGSMAGRHRARRALAAGADPFAVDVLLLTGRLPPSRPAAVRPPSAPLR